MEFFMAMQFPIYGSRIPNNNVGLGQKYEPFVIGISGPSCSGKTTIAKLLKNELNQCALVHQDLFFVDPDLCPVDANFYDLKYLSVDSFLATVNLLCSGSPATVPEIDFSTFRKKGETIIKPSRFIIVEGMTLFRISSVLNKCDLKLYLAPPFKIIKERKLIRDTTERKKSLKEINFQLNWMYTEYKRDLEIFREEQICYLYHQSIKKNYSCVMNKLRKLTNCKRK